MVWIAIAGSAIALAFAVYAFSAKGGSAKDLAERTHAAVLETLETTARAGPPPPGPRGGTRWLPRYFVRRVTWHVLDHAWEIEDRGR
jgi:hypothetical protein